MKDQPTTEKHDTQLVPTEAQAITRPDYGLDVGRAVAMRAAVVEVMQKVMREGIDFGEIPGTTREGKKPKMALLQPGAEVLCQVFRLRPEFHEVALIERDDFLFVKIRCRLLHSITGELVGEAIASANSREEKYASQVAAKLCPVCGKPSIFKSKQDRGGWFCWAKKGGCGATFEDEDKKLLDQTGTVSVDRVWGLYHTLESIAQKRAYVKVTRNATACSDIFTDEPDDLSGEEQGPASRNAGHAAAATTSQAPKADPVKYADAIVLRDLSWAIRDSKMCEVTVADPTKKDEAYRARRLDWINKTLSAIGQKPVDDATKITEAQAKILTELAKKGEKPEGWV
jgi:hypothetical protein